MRILYKEQSETQKIQDILNSIPWSTTDYRSPKPIDNYIFRIADPKEWESIKSDFWSGGGWHTDPTSYGRIGISNQKLMMVSTHKGVLPDKHGVIMTKKGIEDIIAVFKWIGDKWSGRWEIVS